MFRGLVLWLVSDNSTSNSHKMFNLHVVYTVSFFLLQMYVFLLVILTVVLQDITLNIQYAVHKFQLVSTILVVVVAGGGEVYRGRGWGVGHRM